MRRLLSSAFAPAAIVAMAAAHAHAQSARPVDFAFEERPSLTIGAVLRVDFRARIEGDARTATPAVGRHDAEFAWGTPRIGVEGTLWKTIGFEYSHDLGEGAELKDAYVNLQLAPAFELELGRFKIPMSTEALTGRHKLDFVRRSLAAQILAPGRDSGVMTHGRVFGKRVGYQVGYFVGDGDNARTGQARGGRDAIAGRLTLRPLGWTAGPLSPLEIGAALTASRLDGGLGLRGETVFDDGVFFDRLFVKGRRWRSAAEASWQNGPASVTTEYIGVVDERRAAGFAGDDLPEVRARAWYVAGTCLVTGERKKGRVEPHEAFLRGGLGAVELAARIESLRFEDITYPGVEFGFPGSDALLANADRAATVGVNWYLDRYTRVQANVVVERIGDPQRSPAPSHAGRFSSGIVRFQFVW